MNYSSTDSGVGRVYYQYSHDNSTWINNNSNNGFTSSSTSWTISWESVYNYYIRACDGLNNCSSSSLMTIKIDKTAPTVQILTSLENHTNENLGKQRKVTLIVSDNEKGSGLNKDSVCTYSHSVASGVGSFKIGHWPDEEDSKKYYAGFGYSDNSNNTLTVNCKITDVASNITNFKFHCNYGEKKCYKD